VLSLLLLGTLNTPAQWRNQLPPRIPRTPDGKPNLLARTPRVSDGRPDLSGIWHPREDGRYAMDIAADLKLEDVPFQPWSKTLFDSRRDGAHAREDPTTNCLPHGVPKSTPLLTRGRLSRCRDFS